MLEGSPPQSDRASQDERLAKLSRMIPGVIYQYQLFPDGRSCFPYASEGLHKVYGLAPEQVREDAAVVFERLHPDDLEKVRNSTEASARDLSPWRAGYRAILPDGDIVWLSGMAMPERLEDDSILWHGYIREVTAEREAAEGVQRSEALYRAIFDNVNDAIFLHAFDGDGPSFFREVNQRACDLLGYSREELAAFRPGMLEDPAHMPDIAAVAARVQQDGHATFETVLVAKDGRRLPVEIASHLFELEGQPHLLSVARDISERLAADRSLRLSATVFQSSREGIVITDRNNRIEDVNAAYSRITGFSREEALGKNPSIVSSGREPPERYQQMWQALESDGYWNGELLNRRKNGEHYPQSLSITVVRDAVGEITHFIGTLRDLTETRAFEQQVERLSHYDSLTGLPNRDLLYDRLAVQVRTAGKLGAAFAVLYIGLDRFKIINESLGVASGDEVLVEMSQRLATSLRPTDTVSRQGGDEFALVLPDTDAEGAAHVAQKVLAKLAGAVEVQNRTVTVTASIGIAMFPEDGPGAEELLSSANAALHRSKERGRNTYEFFAPQLQEQAQRVFEVENDMRTALLENQLELHYQPKVRLADGRIVGVEALVRWNHPHDGLLMPGRFIPVAEETDLIVQLSNWVLDRALADQAAWRESGLTTVPVAVNISAREFAQSDLPERVQAALSRHAVTADRLELEITESMAMSSSSHAVNLLHQLAEVGVAVSIDDFGTGYSSLSYLKQFSLDHLKIDQSFVRALDDDNRAIITAILGVARGLGFQTIAEGVETREQLRILLELGCEQAQGYLFSRPVPAADFARMLTAPADFGDLLT